MLSYLDCKEKKTRVLPRLPPKILSGSLSVSFYFAPDNKSQIKVQWSSNLSELSNFRMCLISLLPSIFESWMKSEGYDSGSVSVFSEFECPTIYLLMLPTPFSVVSTYTELNIKVACLLFVF